MLFTGLLALVTAITPTGRNAQPLPLVVLAPSAPSTGTLALLITGDGGWSKVDKTIAQKLVLEGNGVVGLNSLHYFQHQHSSAELAADLSQIARTNCERWACQRIVLIGYSMGADVLPFVVNQLAPDVRSKVVQMDLVSLGHEAVFKFTPMQWVGLMVGKTFATLPQLATVQNLPLVCIYGTNDPDPACKDVPQRNAEIIALKSGHVMGRVADELADVIAIHIDRVARKQ